MRTSIQVHQRLSCSLLLSCWLALGGIAAERTAASPEVPPAAKEVFRQLLEAQKPDQSLCAYMDAWLDETGFERLRDHLHWRIKEGGNTANELRCLALVCERLDEVDDALSALTQAAKIAPADDRIWLAGARILARRSDDEAALACIGKISPRASSDVAKEAAQILCHLAEFSANGDDALAILKAIGDARPDDDEFHLYVATSLLRGFRKVALPMIKAGWSASKSEGQHEMWRLLHVRAAARLDDVGTVVRECLTGIEHSRGGSVEEAGFIEYLEGEASLKKNSRVDPFAVAERFVSRPAVVMAMADAMRARDDKAGASAISALLSKANADSPFFRRLWIDSLIDADRMDEATIALRDRVSAAPADDAARVQLALLLREAGRHEDGAAVLETWGTGAGADAARVQRVANLLPLFRSDEEARAWKVRAMKNLPATEPKATVRKPAQERERFVALAKQIADSWKTGGPLPMLLEMHRKMPGDEVVTLELAMQMSERHHPVEHLHLALHQHYAAPDRTSRIRWWRRMGIETQATWATTGLYTTPPETYRLMALRLEMGESPDYWLALGELMGGGRPSPFREALRLAPHDVDARKGLVAAMAQDLNWKREAKPTGAIWRMALPLISGPDACSSRLLLAEIDLHTMKSQRAMRTIFELMDDPGMDEYQAERLALRLMEADEWRSAAVFLHAQVARLPADWGLAYLYGVALKKSGDTAGSIEAFLRLGTTHEYAERSLATSKTFSDDDMVLLESIAPYERKLEFVGRLANTLPMALDRGSHSALQNIGFISKPAVSFMLPTRAGERGFHAMAHLVDLAQSLPSAKRREITVRANEAGLPVPGAIEFGAIAYHDGYAEVLANDPSGPNQLNNPAFAEFWLSAHLASRQAKTFKRNATSNQIKWTQQCSRVLRGPDPASALQAALVWWQNDPASPAARAAVLECIDLCAGKFALVDWTLAFTLEGLPFSVRREPSGAAALSTALDRWLERTREDVPDGPFAYSSAVECRLLLGQWEPAAHLAEAASKHRFKMPDWPSFMPIRERLAFTSIEVQAWPSGVWLADWHLLPGFFPPTRKDLSAPILTKADKPAFRAVLSGIRDRRLRVFWNLAAGDDNAAADEVKAWVIEEPAFGPAIHMAASLALHEGDKSRALDLLHGQAVSMSSGEERTMAMLAYLRAAVCGAEESPSSFNQSFHFTPPPADHREKARSAAMEILPDLSRADVFRRDDWQKALQALDVDPGLVREAIERSEKRRKYTGSVMTWAEKQIEILGR